MNKESRLHKTLDTTAAPVRFRNSKNISPFPLNNLPLPTTPSPSADMLP